MSTTGEWARAYVEECRWAIVPIPEGRKGPRQSGWQRRENCITCPERASNLTGNIGLAHLYSSTMSVDIDDLERAVAWFAERGVDLKAALHADDAVRISSGRPNRAKLLFSVAREVETPPTMKVQGVVEFRRSAKTGATVQDVLPPSIHPDTGQPYTWELGPDAEFSKPPPLPEAVLALWRSLDAGANRTPLHERDSVDARADAADLPGMFLPHPNRAWGLAALNEESDLVRSAKVGERRDTLNASSLKLGSIVAWGALSRNEVETSLLSASAACGLPEEEARKTIKDGLNDGAKNPRGPKPQTTARVGEPSPLIPAVSKQAPYPVDELGGCLADAAHGLADMVCCPPALAAQSVLAAAALAVQGHHDAAHPLGYAVPCSLLLITVAESGERKSTADGLATEAVKKHEQEKADEYRREYADWCNRHEAWKACREKKKRGGPKDTRTTAELADALRDAGAEPKEPIHFQRVLSDPNYEGLVKHMARGHGSLAWFNNEAGQSIGGHALHDDNKLKFGAGLSKLWDGQAIDRIRAGEMAMSLPGRRVTTHLMVQPFIAAPFLSDPVLRSQGWLSRALICEPPSRIGSRPFREPSDADRRRLGAYYDRMGALLELSCPNNGKLNELSPAPLPWSRGARSIWIEFHDTVEGMLAVDSDLAEHRGFGAKLAENAFRVATVIAAFEGKSEVDQSAMAQAIALAGWYADEAVRYRQMASISVELQIAEKARSKLIDPKRWPKDTISVREFMQIAPSRGVRRSKGDAMAVIGTLVLHGWLEPIEGSGGVFKIRSRP